VTDRREEREEGLTELRKLLMDDVVGKVRGGGGNCRKNEMAGE
jgi:hypothetical protein